MAEAASLPLTLWQPPGCDHRLRRSPNGLHLRELECDRPIVGWAIFGWRRVAVRRLTISLSTISVALFSMAFAASGAATTIPSPITMSDLACPTGPIEPGPWLSRSSLLAGSTRRDDRTSVATSHVLR